MSSPDLLMRPVKADDIPRLQEILQAAFAPVFASFRSILGDEIYELAQAREDEGQGALLFSLLEPESGWEVHVAELAGTVVGFVSADILHLSQELPRKERSKESRESWCPSKRRMCW